MHNLYARFVKILEICKKIGKDLVNKEGNIPRRGVVPKFSDLEVLSLSRVSRKIAQEIQRTDCQSNKYFVS